MSEKKNQTAPAPEHIPTRPIGGLDGSNPRGETAACPTGLTDAGAHVAGKEAMTVDPSVPPVPGEGVTDEQVRESGLDDAG
jgi:hypothetical protein